MQYSAATSPIVYPQLPKNIDTDDIETFFALSRQDKEWVKQYANGDACAPLAALEEEDDIEKAVSKFFNAAIDYSTQHACGTKGCFLASSVATSAGHVDGVEKLLSKAIELTDARLSARFEREKIKGKLPEQFPSIERAKLLFDLRQGLVFRARAGLDAKTLKRDIKSRVRMVLDYSDS